MIIGTALIAALLWAVYDKIANHTSYSVGVDY